MTWARFEDRFPWHRKVRPLSDAAFRLQVSATCWSCEHLTDGRVETDELALVSDVKQPGKAATELLRRGLWDVTDGGWLIHDFLVYNESRAVVTARREVDAERKRRGRDARWKPDSSRSPGGVQPDGGVDSGQESKGESVRTGPARPEPKDLEVPNPRSTALSLVARADFDGWWETYPRRVGKKDAKTVYDRLVRTVGGEVLLRGAARYRDDLTRDPAFTAHPATWLRGGRWDDEGPVRPPSTPAATTTDKVRNTLALAEQFRLLDSPEEIA